MFPIRSKMQLANRLFFAHLLSYTITIIGKTTWDWIVKSDWGTDHF